MMPRGYGGQQCVGGQSFSERSGIWPQIVPFDFKTLEYLHVPRIPVDLVQIADNCSFRQRSGPALRNENAYDRQGQRSEIKMHMTDRANIQN